MTSIPINLLKQALREKRRQLGLWLSLGDATSAEICAGAGFDWLLVDGEHAPHHAHSVLDQLRAIAAYPATQAVARVPSCDPVTIKQYLDLGVQTLLIPMVESPEQAAAVVRACRYPPAGDRGIGGARAARWGRIADYLHQANDQIAVVVQVESATGLANLEAIAATDGVDAIFLGPADLAASLDHLAEPGHAEVRAALFDALDRLRALGKAAGLLSRNEAFVRASLERGASMVAVGLDAHVLAVQTRLLAERFQS